MLEQKADFLKFNSKVAYPVRLAPEVTSMQDGGVCLGPEVMSMHAEVCRRHHVKGYDREETQNMCLKCILKSFYNN